MSGEAFGHVPVCVATTVQVYRKAIKPENCNECKAYWVGRSDAAQAVHDLEHGTTLGVKRFRAAAIEAARGSA